MMAESYTLGCSTQVVLQDQSEAAERHTIDAASSPKKLLVAARRRGSPGVLQRQRKPTNCFTISNAEHDASSIGNCCIGDSGGQAARIHGHGSSCCLARAGSCHSTGGSHPALHDNEPCQQCSRGSCNSIMAKHAIACWSSHQSSVSHAAHGQHQQHQQQQQRRCHDSCSCSLGIACQGPCGCHSHTQQQNDHAEASAAEAALSQQHGRLSRMQATSFAEPSVDSTGKVTSRMHAASICCPMESRLIHRILDNLPGVLSVNVTVITKTVTVEHQPKAISPAALVAALNSAGLQASLNGRHSNAAAETEQQPQQQGLWHCLLQLQHHPSLPPLSMIVAGLLLLLNLVLLPLPAALLQQGLLALVAAAVGTPPVLQKAWAGLKNRNIDMNCLVVVAFAGAIGLGEWFEAGALVFLFTLAEWLEDRCVSRAAGALEDILRLQPETALVIVEPPGAQFSEEQGMVVSAAEHNSIDASPGASCCAGSGQCGGSDCCNGSSSSSAGSLGGSRSKSGSDSTSCLGASTGAQYQQHYHQLQHHCPNPQGCSLQLCYCRSSSCRSSSQIARLSGCSQNSCSIHDCRVECSQECHSMQCQPEQPGRQKKQQPSTKQPGPSCCASGCCTLESHAAAMSQLLPMPVVQLQAGVLVLVRPGDRVPVDGLIESGASVLDESMVTGESKPITKSVGQPVLAGTVNSGSAALQVRATAAAGDSTVARLAALMETAAASKSKQDAAVEAFVKWYTPTVVLVALLTFVIGSLVQPAAWRHWAYLSLVVLVTGCPCALVISTPVASVAGLTRAARRGVLIKGGRYLELLGRLSGASFDKSGTLTEGHFQLTELHTFGQYTQEQALQLAAALEQHSNHPIAHAIVGAAAARGCVLAAGAASEVSEVIEVAGKGLTGQMGGQQIAVGSWAFAQKLAQGANPGMDAAAGSKEGARAAPTGVQQQQNEEQQGKQQTPEHLSAIQQLMDSANSGGATAVCVVIDQQVSAVLLLSDRPRKNTPAALEQMQQLGVRCFMLTGDNMGAAAHIASQIGIGIGDVHAELLPHEKLEWLKLLRRKLASEQQQEDGWDAPEQAYGLFAGTQSSSSNCFSCHQVECKCLTISGLNGQQIARQHAAAAKCSSTAIAHVGDGINDAPALAAADVGIAMGVAGAALAVDASDVALFSNDLTSLPFAIRLGRRARWIITANTIFACSIKVGVLAAAAGGVASLWLSLLADVGSSLLVTLHALTLLHFEAGQHEHSDASTGHASSSSSTIRPTLSLDSVERQASSKNLSNAHSSSSDMGLVSPYGSSSMGWWQRLLLWLPGGSSSCSWQKPYYRLHEDSAASAGQGDFGQALQNGSGAASSRQQQQHQHQHKQLKECNSGHCQVAVKQGACLVQENKYLQSGSKSQISRKAADAVRTAAGLPSANCFVLEDQ